ncbi:uncharacterized protein LOC106664067 isoform X2 [Cimex lectularius]|uniref:DUF4773 domain-containing protein n=1 Tax=Cimex lectularius TaxID=79782 RepID=A0A8I6RKB0_CIMLE|nr:uncharacterized protein LOC106664067 isoform X2 [Cimex lectularius]
MIVLYLAYFTLTLATLAAGSTNETRFQIYYDADGNPVPELDGTENKLKTGIKRFGFLPCSCEDEFNCGCCVNLRFIRFKRAMCSNLTFDPMEFSILMKMDFDGAVILNRTLSAKNPPPACFDQPYIPGVRFCVNLFDIYTPGRNLHMCINFEARFINSPILVLEFDCIQMGNDGFIHAKPFEFPQRNTTIDKIENLYNEEENVVDLTQFQNSTNNGSNSSTDANQVVN